MKKGKLIIFSAPSGAGKTTIVQHLLAKFPDKIAFSISATTRPARGDEQHEKDYMLVDLQILVYLSMSNKGFFLVYFF